MNLVFEIRGAGVTVAENVHDAVRLSESVAVHSTVVEPTPSVEPEASEHDTLTGAAPPVTCGAANVTCAPAFDVAPTVIDGGHKIPGGSAIGAGGGVWTGGGGVGVGDAG